MNYTLLEAPVVREVHPSVIVNLRKFDHRAGNVPFRNTKHDSVNVGYAGMKLSLAQVNNTPRMLSERKAMP